jgi:putative transposase
MRKSKFTPEQILEALRQAESGTTVVDICHKLGVTETSFYRSKKSRIGHPSGHGPLPVGEAGRCPGAAARSFSGNDVARMLSDAGDRRGGLPPIIQCDTSTALDHWAYGARTTTTCDHTPA